MTAQNKLTIKLAGLLAFSIIAFVSFSPVSAAPTSTFNQTINAGTLTTDIRSDATTSVTSPSITMSAVSSAFGCTTTTGTFGAAGQRLYVDNPDAADNGWTLTVAPGSTTTLWENTGATNKFDFNDATGSGCTDGVDTDTYGGQMTVNANAGTLTADCTGCTTTNITKGTSTAFSEGTTNSATLLTAAANSDDITRVYLTGVGISQTIPANTAADAYSINMTLTVAAS